MPQAASIRWGGDIFDTSRRELARAETAPENAGQSAVKVQELCKGWQVMLTTRVGIEIFSIAEIARLTRALLHA